MKLIKSGLTFNQAIQQIIKNKELLISRKGKNTSKTYLNFKDWGDDECEEPKDSGYLRDTEIWQSKKRILAFSFNPSLKPDDFLAKDWQVWEFEG